MATSAAASSCASPDLIEETNIEFSTILEVIPQLSPGQLLEVIQLAAKELGKSGKSLQKMEKTAGVRPPQLSKSQSWTDYVLTHAKENGWEPFTMQEKKKNKLTGEVVVEVAEMPCSEEGADGVHVFVGMFLKDGMPKTFNMKEAMSLAKKLKEENAPLYQQYLVETKADAPAAKAAPKRVTKTAEQIEEERVAKLKAEAQAKAEKKRVADEAKAEKKRLAEEKKAEEKAAKAQAAKPVVPKTLTIKVKRAATPPPAIDAAAPAPAPVVDAAPAPAPAKKAAKKAAAPAPEPVVATPTIDAAAAAPAPAKKAAKKPATPVAAAPVPMKTDTKKSAKAATPVAARAWVAPEDDETFLPWTFEGTTYFRNRANGIISCEQDWVGLYIEAENRIDKTVAEPGDVDEKEEKEAAVMPVKKVVVPGDVEDEKEEKEAVVTPMGDSDTEDDE